MSERQVEMLDRKNWEEFLSSPLNVLILAKSDCGACKTWQAELNEFLKGDEDFSKVRFGNLELDQPGLVGFKRANPWVAEIHDLPYTLIYKDGEQFKKFAGGGVERLTNRLRRAL